MSFSHFNWGSASIGLLIIAGVILVIWIVLGMYRTGSGSSHIHDWVNDNEDEINNIVDDALKSTNEESTALKSKIDKARGNIAPPVPSLRRVTKRIAALRRDMETR